MIRVSLHNEQLDVRMIRGLGFQAECSCGWKGHRTRQRTTAAAEMAWHKWTTHEKVQAS